MKNESVSINGITVPPGESATLELPVAKLYTHSPISIPIHVINGKRAGARLFVSAAIHGDEINGVEIIHRLLRQKAMKQIRGTLIAVPVVNVHGFINHSRYLPDRRDLNRSFPGSETGSLAARLAYLFINEIVRQCTHGIDLHTGAIHRDNLPQIRANLDDSENLRLAKAFGVPVLLNSDVRDGSLREAADALGIPMLLYEAGEALRFDELSIRAGVRGILNVMRTLEMLPPRKAKKEHKQPTIARTSYWVRAPTSGIFLTTKKLGEAVTKNDTIGKVADPFGQNQELVSSPYDGIIIGRTNLPLVNEGDALLHIARFQNTEKVAGYVEDFQSQYAPEPVPPAGESQ
ncbi:MAG: succinylglutamate desuccinylase/aspartoacylase family protein [Gammaproteobacteria bacterium]|jgi:hypothetical protein